MKKITAVIFAAVLVFTCIPFFAGAAAWDGTGKEAYTGSGTEADPYVIDTAAKLAKIGEVVAGGDTLDGKYFVQTADIDLGGKEWTPIGDGTNPFSGIYNGKGHKISGFSITKLSNFTGLFGKIVAADNEAGVCNLTIDGSINISGSGTDAAPSVGAVAGQVNNNVAVAGKKNAVFTNITSNVDITLASQTQQPRAGGLFGQMYLAVVENCVNNGNLTTDASNVARLGGFTGQFIRCTFKGCVNNGKVTASTTGSKGVNIAGFAAYCTGPAKEADESVSDRYSVIENCINNGEISGTAEGNVAVAVGGIVGNFYTAVKENYLKITNCLNTGKLCAKQNDGGSAYSYVGGMVGNAPNNYAHIFVEKCVNTSADIQGVGGKEPRAAAIAGAFYAPGCPDNTRGITDAVSAADDTLPIAVAYNVAPADKIEADKATWVYDAARATARAAEIKGLIAKSTLKINGIDVNKQDEPAGTGATTDVTTDQPGQTTPPTGDSINAVVAVTVAALIAAACAVYFVKFRKIED